MRIVSTRTVDWDHDQQKKSLIFSFFYFCRLSVFSLFFFCCCCCWCWGWSLCTRSESFIVFSHSSRWGLCSLRVVVRWLLFWLRRRLLDAASREEKERVKKKAEKKALSRVWLLITEIDSRGSQSNKSSRPSVRPVDYNCHSIRFSSSISSSSPSSSSCAMSISCSSFILLFLRLCLFLFRSAIEEAI